MRNDGRLSRMLHVLIHLARHDGRMTSDAIAKMLDTNPVLVRRTMAGLRDAGYVRSEKGHGGGWAIAADLETVTLLDVHHSVGGPRVFAIGIEDPVPGCQVADIVNEAVSDALRDAESLLIERLGSISLASLVRTFDERHGVMTGAEGRNAPQACATVPDTSTP